LSQPEGDALPFRTKAIYALGDHTVNLGLSAMLFLFPLFLTDVAMLRPTLAGAIPLIARGIDAFADPAMGRFSDATRWRAGRRRPFFLIGALPLGASFAALWATPDWGDWGKFAYYLIVYVLFALSTTVLSVPYLALIPEMATSYQERTSVNSFRAAGAILGTLLAVAVMRPLVTTFGGGEAGWLLAGLVFGCWLAAPWPLVHRATFERPGFQREGHEPFLRSIRSLAQHTAYARLTGLFLLGRIAIDLTSTMFLFYFTYWLGRPEDFEPTLGLFLLAIVGSLPMWLAISKRVEKRTLYVLGAASWIGSQLFLLAATPEWPRLWIFVGAAIGGVGYAAADMIPWSMLGEVVDEDELRSGERREGLYYGLFTFLRKLGGASAVFVALALLDLSGYVANQPQSQTTITTIRVLTAVVPGVFVALGAWVALHYPLTRARHDEILRGLAARRAGASA
jgi:glycoside/pentoside/hexuronide:cation symporter, GPH family